MKEIYEVLVGAPAFTGIESSAIEGLLQDLGAFEQSYGRNDVLFHVGDTLDAFPVLLAGKVKASLIQGDRVQTVAWFKAGDSFAEAVPVSLGACPVEVDAQTDAQVLFIPAKALQESTSANARMLHANLITEMSKKVASLSMKLSLLSEPRLSDRLLRYLATLPKEADGTVRVPLKYTDLADYLGVNKVSLSRTLRTMEDEGLIEQNGRVIRVLAKQALAKGE